MYIRILFNTHVNKDYFIYLFIYLIKTLVYVLFTGLTTVYVSICGYMTVFMVSFHYISYKSSIFIFLLVISFVDFQDNS